MQWSSGLSAASSFLDGGQPLARSSTRARPGKSMVCRLQPAGAAAGLRVRHLGSAEQPVHVLRRPGEFPGAFVVGDREPKSAQVCFAPGRPVQSLHVRVDPGQSPPDSRSRASTARSDRPFRRPTSLACHLLVRPPPRRRRRRIIAEGPPRSSGPLALLSEYSAAPAEGRFRESCPDGPRFSSSRVIRHPLSRVWISPSVRFQIAIRSTG